MTNASISLEQRRINLTEIKFKKLHPDAVLPQYAHGPDEDAGMDLYAVEDVVLVEHNPTLVSTGLAIELPAGIEGQIRSRSGLALKEGLTVANSPGTVDPGFRGELKVILSWSPTSAIRSTFTQGYALQFEVKAGAKIAQLVIAPYLRSKPVWSNELAESERGEGGFGSTGF